MFNKLASKYVPLLGALDMLPEEITALEAWQEGSKAVDAVLWVHYGCQSLDDVNNVLFEHYCAEEGTCGVEYDLDDALELVKSFTCEQTDAVKARVADNSMNGSTNE
jgi:hypothetical protein